MKPTITDDALRARILHHDTSVLVVDKPAGLAVHRGPSTGSSLEDMLDALRFDLPHPPRLVHRLDRDTSGCLVLARHHRTVRRLGRLFAEGRVEKTYWAVVEGAPPDAAGRVDRALAKRTSKSGWRMVTDPQGQPAVTDYRVLGTAPGLAWLELAPHTGRTHQLRVHCAAIGCPVLGDAVYGGGSATPLHLHARRIAIPLHEGRPPIIAEAPLPESLLATFRRCGFVDGAPLGAADPAHPPPPLTEATP
jgi:tRNA pseudouridine32 synthase / 23S rRNA pseudouridine746 synthase